eukprot:1582270-Pyramimonas_sp.AAC.1
MKKGSGSQRSSAHPVDVPRSKPTREATGASRGGAAPSKAPPKDDSHWEGPLCLLALAPMSQ